MKIPLPKGTLIPIGGGEDKEESKTVLCRVIDETGKKRPQICVVTVATNLPDEVGDDYRKAFSDLGIESVTQIHFDRRPDADREEHIERIKECDAVLFSGGNQL